MSGVCLCAGVCVCACLHACFLCVGGMRNGCVADSKPIRPEGQRRPSEPGTGMLGGLSGLGSILVGDSAG